MNDFPGWDQEYHTMEELDARRSEPTEAILRDALNLPVAETDRERLLRLQAAREESAFPWGAPDEDED
jgi:hypothetical protein